MGCSFQIRKFQRLPETWYIVTDNKSSTWISPWNSSMLLEHKPKPGKEFANKHLAVPLLALLENRKLSFPRIFLHLIGCWTEQTWRVWIMLEGCAFCKQIYMLMNVLASGFLFLFIGPFKHVSSGEIKEAGRKALFVWSERCLLKRLRVKEFSVIARVSFIRIYSLATHAAEVIFPCAKWCFILDCDIEVPFHC